MLFFLALRNITRNLKNSVIIALLIALITFLFFIGNSVMGRVEITIRRAYTESLTGDVVIEKAGDISMNLFGANTPVIDSYFNIPPLSAHDEVLNLVSAEKGVAGITSQVSGSAYLDLLGVREPVLLCGVDAGSYFSLFPGIILEEGAYLKAGEYGAMITEERARKIEAQSGQRPAVGAPLLLTSGGIMGFKIREVPLAGIFRYENPGQFMNEIVITDPQTVRVLNSIQVASAAAGETGGNYSSLLENDIDALFGESGAEGINSDGGNRESDFSAGSGFSVETLESFLAESKTAQTVEESGGDWHFIIIRLEDEVSPGSFISSLNEKIESYGLTAVNWRIAAGTSAILPLLVQALYNAGLFLVTIAGVIAVINILLISVFRRTREIGTLRAIGAPDAYIRSLVLYENLIIALAAGLAGVLGGYFLLRWVNSLGLQISNGLIVSILGSPVLRFELLPHIAVFSFCVAVIFAFAASVYPVEVTVRIEPIVAVRRG